MSNFNGVIMSVIMESMQNDRIKIISEFTASPLGQPFSFDTTQDFHIGDSVRYYDYYKDENLSQEYLSWKVIFIGENGLKYAATQLYFTTIDEWEIIEDYFKSFPLVH